MKSGILHILFLSGMVLCCGHREACSRAVFLPDAQDGEWAGHTVSEDYNVYSSCVQDGYKLTSCPEGSTPSGYCPLYPTLFEKCISNSEVCRGQGYVISCPEGEEADYSQRCPQDSVYTKCKCAACLGYDYTEVEANSDGYIADGEPCLSCQTEKYKRKINPCEGYEYDAGNCGVNSCGKLAGDTCQSGSTLKYKKCDPCPAPSPTCSDGSWNLDNYWCNGALRCWLPQSN